MGGRSWAEGEHEGNGERRKETAGEESGGLRGRQRDGEGQRGRGEAGSCAGPRREGGSEGVAVPAAQWPAPPPAPHLMVPAAPRLFRRRGERGAPAEGLSFRGGTPHGDARPARFCLGGGATPSPAQSRGPARRTAKESWRGAGREPSGAAAASC